MDFGFGPGSLPAGAKVLSAEVHAFQDGGQSVGHGAGRPTTPSSGPAPSGPTGPGEAEQLSTGRCHARREPGLADLVPPALGRRGAGRRRATPAWSCARPARRSVGRPWVSAPPPVRGRSPTSRSPTSCRSTSRPSGARHQPRHQEEAAPLHPARDRPGGVRRPHRGGVRHLRRVQRPVRQDRPDHRRRGRGGRHRRQPEFAVGNLVTVWGDGTTLSDLTVQECRPDPEPGRHHRDDRQRRHPRRPCLPGHHHERHGPGRARDVRRRQGPRLLRDHGLRDLGHRAERQRRLRQRRRHLRPWGGWGRIQDNSVHDHTWALIRNTEGGGDDFGAAGITFDHVLAGQGGYVAERNNAHRQRGRVLRLRVRRRRVRDLRLVRDRHAQQHPGRQRHRTRDRRGHRQRPRGRVRSATRSPSNTVVGYNADFPKTPYAPQRLARKGLVLRCDEDMLVTPTPSPTSSTAPSR